MQVFFVRPALWLGLMLATPALWAGTERAPGPLSALAAEVLRTHPRAEAAREALAAARARLRAASRAVYNPELELETEEAGGVRTSTVQLSQSIDLGDRRGARTREAQALLEAAEATASHQLQALARDLLASLAAHDTAAALARLAQRRLDLMHEFARVAEERAAAGDLGPAELNLARLALNEAVVTAASARADALEAREQLRTLLDPLPRRLPSLDADLPEARLPEDVDAFLLQVPRVRAVRARVEAAQGTVQLREAERAWDPTIALRGGKEGEESLTGIVVTLPLNVRNTFSAEVDAARAEYLQAEKEAAQAYRLARAQLISVAERYRLTRRAWRDWRRTGQTSIRSQLALLERLWRAGDMSTADYLVQVQQTLDTRAAGIELRGRLWRAWADWLLATGRILTWLDIAQTTGRN